MSGFSYYVLRQIAVGTVLVTFGLAYILWLTQSLRFIELIVNKGLSIALFLELTLLLLPGFLAIIIPIALFAVTLFVFNKLIMDRELVVVRAAGVSNMGIAAPALVFAGITTLLCYALTLSLAPQSVQSFKSLQWTIRNDLTQLLLQDGTFNEISDGLTIYVGSRGDQGQLVNVIIHDTRDPERTVTMMAEQGTLTTDGLSPRIEMFSGNRQEVATAPNDLKDDTLSLLYFDRYAVELGDISKVRTNRYPDVRERPTADLFRLSEADGLPAKQIGKLRAEGHKRLADPLANMGYAIIALAFLLRGGIARQGMGWRIGGAVICMVAVQAAALGAGSLTAKNPALAPLIYLNALAPILAGLYMLGSSTVARPSNRRVQRWLGQLLWGEAQDP